METKTLTDKIKQAISAVAIGGVIGGAGTFMGYISRDMQARNQEVNAVKEHFKSEHNDIPGGRTNKPYIEVDHKLYETGSECNSKGGACPYNRERILRLLPLLSD